MRLTFGRTAGGRRGRRDRLVVRLNSNVKMSRHKAAAQAIHAALILRNAHHGGPVIVLGANRSSVEACEVVVHDAGRTEVDPGTLTAGASWEPVEIDDDVDVTPDAVVSSQCADDDIRRALTTSATIWTRGTDGLYSCDQGRRARPLRSIPGVRAAVYLSDDPGYTDTDGQITIHASAIALPELLAAMA